MTSILISLLFISEIDPKPVFSERIEARVGKQIIVTSDLQAAMRTLAARTSEEKSEKTLRDAAFASLIEKFLIRDYLERNQMAVTDQEVERRINTIMSSSGAPTIEDFKMRLASQGLNFESFRTQIRDQLENSQLMQVLQRQTVQTTDEKELRAYYKEHEILFKKNPELEVSECVLSFKEGKEVAQAAAQKYKKNPKTFDACITTSESPSKLQNGKLGKIRIGDLREDVEKSLFQLAAGQVTLIEGPQGIQLLKVTARRELGPRSFEDARAEIRNRIESERLIKARERLITDLRGTTFVKIES